jgi:hypothetical protein
MSHKIPGLALLATLSAVGLKPAVTAATTTTTPTTTTATTQAPGGSGTIAARARSASPVVARHGTSTDIPLTGDPWTQSSGELELVAGTVDFGIPGSCTGAFGNALTLSVDGKVTTFASAPTAPASRTLTLPFLIGTLSEPGQDAQHKLSAKFGNSCTKDGEDYTIKDVKVDVLKFH